jgi:hypothetical protein
VSRGVDQVELVVLAGDAAVRHAHRVELDRDAALTLELVVVEHLLAHLTLVERARALEKSVREGRLPVVDVRHDAEIADVVGLHCVGRARSEDFRSPES